MGTAVLLNSTDSGSGTVQVPAGVTELTILMCGKGGTGANGIVGNGGMGGGGGGLIMGQMTVYPLENIAWENDATTAQFGPFFVSAGADGSAGGAGGNATDGDATANGGDAFGTIDGQVIASTGYGNLVLYGGGGGQAGSSSNPGGASGVADGGQSFGNASGGGGGASYGFGTDGGTSDGSIGQDGQEQYTTFGEGTGGGGGGLAGNVGSGGAVISNAKIYITYEEIVGWQHKIIGVLPEKVIGIGKALIKAIIGQGI